MKKCLNCFKLIALITILGLFTLTGCTNNKEENNISKVNENNINQSDNNKININTGDTQDGKDGIFEIEYKEETYITKNDNGEVVFENKRNLPIIKSSKHSNSAEKIQKSLTEISNKNWNYIKETSDEYKDSPSKTGINYMLGTSVFGKNYISFMANQSGSFGGTSWSAEELYTYDIETGELLNINSFAKDEKEFKEFLTKKVKEYVKENFDESALSGLDSKVKDIIEKSGNYGMQYGSFSIILPKYSIGAGADGVRVVEISKDEINSYLKDRYQIN